MTSQPLAQSYSLLKLSHWSLNREENPLLPDFYRRDRNSKYQRAFNIDNSCPTWPMRTDLSTARRDLRLLYSETPSGRCQSTSCATALKKPALIVKRKGATSFMERVLLAETAWAETIMPGTIVASDLEDTEDKLQPL